MASYLAIASIILAGWIGSLGMSRGTFFAATPESEPRMAERSGFGAHADESADLRTPFQALKESITGIRDVLHEFTTTMKDLSENARRFQSATTTPEETQPTSSAITPATQNLAAATSSKAMVTTVPRKTPAKKITAPPSAMAETAAELARAREPAGGLAELVRIPEAEMRPKNTAPLSPGDYIRRVLQEFFQTMANAYHAITD